MVDEMTDARLRGRKTVSIYDGGQLRLPREMWRALGSPEDRITVDLVETDEGTEVRLR